MLQKKCIFIMIPTKQNCTITMYQYICQQKRIYIMPLLHPMLHQSPGHFQLLAAVPHPWLVDQLLCTKKPQSAAHWSHFSSQSLTWPSHAVPAVTGLLVCEYNVHTVLPCSIYCTGLQIQWVKGGWKKNEIQVNRKW